MVPRARLYVFAITVRRASMAFVNAFVTLIDLRVVLIRTILLQAFLLHLFVRQPFASKWVNRADELSMLVLLGVMMLQSKSVGQHRCWCCGAGRGANRADGHPGGGRNNLVGRICCENVTKTIVAQL
jgi:hypothetical protein